MQRTMQGIGTALLPLLIAGCAGYSIQEGGTGTGYDVYAPHPYLTRTVKDGADGKPVVSFDVIYLPDYSRRYRVRSWAGLGKANFTFIFDDGWKLTKIVDQSDNSAVAESIAKLAGIVKDFGFSGADDPQMQRAASDLDPMLYRVEFGPDGKVCGLTPIQVGQPAGCTAPPLPCAPPCRPPCLRRRVGDAPGGAAR